METVETETAGTVVDEPEVLAREYHTGEHAACWTCHWRRRTEQAERELAVRGEILEAAVERAEAAEAERDSAVTLADTVLRQAMNVTQERDRLRAAILAVEWMAPWNDNAYLMCPWCSRTDGKGHLPDCTRQAALAAAESKEGE